MQGYMGEGGCRGHRYRIESARTERPTAQQTTDRQPGASAGSVNFQSFDRVAGATGSESTGRGAALGRTLVPPNGGDQAAGGPFGGEIGSLATSRFRSNMSSL